MSKLLKSKTTKFLVGSMLGLSLLVSAPSASAALTADQVSAILGLLNSFGADVATVNNVQASLTGDSPVISQSATTSGDSPVVGQSTETSLDLGADVLRLGSRGQYVRNLQTLLDLQVDGVFGNATRSRIIELQRQNGLSPDGVVGPATTRFIFNNQSEESENNTTTDGCVISSFTANGLNSVTVSNNEGVLLKWETDNCTNVRISNLSPNSGSYPMSGSVQILHPQTGKYTLVANKSDDSIASKSVNITVGLVPAPAISRISGPQTLNINQTGTWTISALDPSGGTLLYSVNWDYGNDELQPTLQKQQSATFTHSYGATGTYKPTFIVTNSAGKISKTSLSVVVGESNISSTKPVVSISASPSSITTGQSSTLTWSATNSPTSCYLSDAGGVGATGSKTVYPTASTTYTVTCTNSSGTGTGSATVSIVVPEVGDVDGNGFINCTDLTMIMDAAVGKIVLTNEQKVRADINGSGTITASDGLALAQNNNLSCTISISPSKSLLANTLGAIDDLSKNKNSQEKIHKVTNNIQTSSCREFTQTLMKGMINPQVKCLQKTLNEKGFKIKGTEENKETEYFGYDTMTALKAFQSANGLVADGVFGKISREALIK